MTIRRTAAILVLALLAACASTPTGGETERTHACSGDAALPSGLGLDPFYEQYCVVHGIAIVASDVVPAAALEQARSILAAMLANVASGAIESIVAYDVRVGIIGQGQVTTDMPEHADLNDVFPGTDWDGATRGVAATPPRPLTSAAEENVLCTPSDVYAGESILVHEFAHTVHELGVASIDATFQARLDTAYAQAMAADLWEQTYAATNATEYWAEGVQSYFDANGHSDPPNGVHNHVATRAQLATYDPGLYALVDEVFGGSELGGHCPA